MSSGVSGIPFHCFQLPIEFTDRDSGISAEIIVDPRDLSRCMRVRVRRMRSMRLITQRIFGAILSLVSAHEGRFGDMIAPAYEGNTDAGAVKFDRMGFDNQFIWQISW